MADDRKLEKVKNNPGIYRRHANGCTRLKKCKCPYIVRWKALGQSHKQMFSSWELAREFKGTPQAAVIEDGRCSLRGLDRDVRGPHIAWLGGLDAPGLRAQLPAAHPAAGNRANPPA